MDRCSRCEALTFVRDTLIVCMNGHTVKVFSPVVVDVKGSDRQYNKTERFEENRKRVVGRGICIVCGEEYDMKRRIQKYCMTVECQKARRAAYTQAYRERQQRELSTTSV